MAMRKINGWLTILWFIAAFPICFYFSSSVPFLVFISVYAVVTGHLSTWQSARVEVKQSNVEADIVDALVTKTTIEPSPGGTPC